MRVQSANTLIAILEHRKELDQNADQSTSRNAKPALGIEDAKASPIAISKRPWLIGHGVEVRASIALAQPNDDGVNQKGFSLDQPRLAELLVLAEREYQDVSAVLAQNPEAQPCFKWDEKIVRLTKKRYPEVDSKKLCEWLNSTLHKLCDVQNQGAAVPRNANGHPVVNPEHWGIWPGCDRTLWAWRQVFRMAEVARIGNEGENVCPRYEILPALRSFGPNLTVYRQIGKPVFRPRDGHVFVVGKLFELRARSAVAVSVLGGYVHANTARLYQYVLLQ